MVTAVVNNLDTWNVVSFLADGKVYGPWAMDTLNTYTEEFMSATD